MCADCFHSHNMATHHSHLEFERFSQSSHFRPRLEGGSHNILGVAIPCQINILASVSTTVITISVIRVLISNKSGC